MSRIVPGLNLEPFIPVRYEWSKWDQDGQSHELIQGVDYHCKHESMRENVHRRAKKIGKHGMARLNEDGGGLYVQFAIDYSEEYLRSHPDSLIAIETRRRTSAELDAQARALSAPSG